MPMTPWDTIPDFAANPTLVSVRSGNWSDPAAWAPARVPGAGDVVSVLAGHTITYDASGAAAVKTVAVQGALSFRTDINTQLVVVNLVVLPGGYLGIGTAANPVAAGVVAQVVFADQPVDTTADPGQYGNGLIALGKVTVRGAAKAPFINLAVEPHAGDTTLHLSQPAAGWLAGDQLFLPDSRQLDRYGGGDLSPHWEYLTVASVSADGLTVTLTAALQYDHPGARDAAGQLRYLPDVANLTRNVLIKSANPSGTRGYCLLTYRADVDMENAAFLGLGRTTSASSSTDDRYPVTFRHVMGSYPTTGNYQYTFLGNVVTCPLDPMPYWWGIAISDSHYGLIKDNVVVNWYGAGIACDGGAESYNVLDHNFVARVGGTGVREDLGACGVAFWVGAPLNYYLNNVATCVCALGTYSYGYAMNLTDLYTQPVPAFQGADMSVPGQTVTVNLNAVAVAQFENNTVYGGTPNGASFWWINSQLDTPQGGPGSTVRGLVVWNVWQWGIFNYQTSGVTFDGPTFLGDRSLMNAGHGGIGFFFSDYQNHNLTITSADIENQAVGVEAPVRTGGTATTISNGYFDNQTDVAAFIMWTVQYTCQNLPPKSLVLTNNRHGLSAPGAVALAMVYPDDGVLGYETVNLVQSDQVTVNSHNGVAGVNFHAYYTQQAAAYVVPVTTLNSDGSVHRAGAPVAGLTNAQCWAQYSLAVAGAVAPADAATRPDVSGLVKSF